MRTKRILHIGKYYPPFFGGIERVNYDLVESLNEKPDCQVDELCFAHTKEDFVEYTTDKYKLFRVPIYGIKFSTPLPKGYFALYKKIRNDYDIIHIHLPNPIAGLAPCLFSTKAKIVLHWHSDILKQKFFLRLYKPLQTLLLKRADAIIATSDAYFKASEDLAPYASKVKIVQIGIDTSYLKADPKDVQVIKETYPNKKIVLSIGRLTYYKGFEYLIKAAKEMDDDVVVLIGGSGELESSLKHLVQSEGLSDKVFFLGRVEQKLMGAYFQAADLYCMSSIMRTEAFGVVLIESLSNGLPIVAFQIPGSGVNWVNADELTGRNVPLKDTKALAQAVNTILSDEQLAHKYRENALQRYKEQFSKDAMVEKVYKIYQEISEKSE